MVKRQNKKKKLNLGWKAGQKGRKTVEKERKRKERSRQAKTTGRPSVPVCGGGE